MIEIAPVERCRDGAAPIKLGYVQEPVAVHWADSCSRPRPDSFSGGAALVTRKRVYWFCVPDLVEKKLEALGRRRRA